MANGSTGSCATTNEGEKSKLKMKPENYPTYQSHLSTCGSSSTSAPHDDYKYDVFLSFRGEDTRNRFIGHLYKELIQNGISVFKDDEELDRGKQISPELLRAIEDSRFSMIVFSKKYATSSWCLDELVHILECTKPGKSIFPIFYDVDPSVVRHQSGTYAAAFAELKEKHPAEKVEKWRSALRAVANISGWHLNYGNEVEFIQKIVQDVSRKLTGTFEGFSGEINHQFPWDGTDSGVDDEFKYDVFLSSNMDEDTVMNFSNDLSTALDSKGMIIFKENEEWDKGKDMSAELLRAIKGSRLFIIILSTNYAASRWCLDQLVHILGRRMTSVNRVQVLPIFYNVEAKEVQHQTGGYKKAFAEHENYKHKLENVERWRSALTEVGSLSGWDLNNGCEQVLIRDIVGKVTRLLSKGNYEFKQLVGIDSRANKLLSILDISEKDARFIGIWGMAGIGKSTIARLIYSKISDEYEACCYPGNVREYSQRKGLVALQQMLLASLLMQENVIIHGVQHGIQWIRQCFCHKKCLLVLDDVDELEQLEALAGEADWFGVGSRIIITTRDAHLLNLIGVHKMYTCEGLNPAEATEVLSLNAFKRKQPPDGYEMMCKEILDYANGVPLALKIVGCFLFRKSIEEWKSSLYKMNEIPHRDIFNVLRISYDSLDEEWKHMFLDIACFFNGKKVDRVLEVLASCGFHVKIGMAILIDKSLVTISNDILCMPKWIQQMGWEIVRLECREPGRRSRLWHQQDIDKIIGRNLGTRKIEAMVLDQHELECNWSDKAFEGMHNLRLLKICCKVNLPKGLQYLPENLKFLKWRGYPLKHLPSNFYPCDLVELNMCHAQIELLWSGEKFFSNLKFIKLSHSENLIRTPDFTGVSNLERLILEGCRNLQEVHHSIGTLKKLSLLNLKDCSSLLNLPDLISAESLETCVLSGCSRLDKFPYIDGSMRNLSQLYLDGIRPKIFLKSTFDFASLLPSKRRKWNNLACLLPNIPSIKKLSLRNCDLPEGSIPSDLGYLTSLEVLDLGRNKFISLPTGISQLVKLKILGLGHCNLLQSVPELPSNIEYVEARDCSSLVTFSNPFRVRTSKDLKLSFIGCYKLKQNQEGKSIMMALLKAYLQSLLKISNQELSHITGRFDIVIPGTRIPEWFKHQNMGHTVKISLPPKWSNNNWIGFIFCVAFGVHEDVPGDKDSQLELENAQKITCRLCTNEGISTGFGFNISRGTFIEAPHLWVRYVSNECFGERMAKWSRTRYINVSFEIESQRLEVKRCGFRVVYKQDMEETSKENLDFIFPPLEELALQFFSVDT